MIPTSWSTMRGSSDRLLRLWKRHPIRLSSRSLAINVIGPFLVSSAVLPGMLARKYGRIINIDFRSRAEEGAPECSPYGVSKAGLISMTKTMAEGIGPPGGYHH